MELICNSAIRLLHLSEEVSRACRGNPKASLTTQDNASKSSHQLPNRDLKSSLLGLHRCTDMQQALDSLQEASGGPVEAGRGVVTSAGGRQVKKALRNFADAHQGSS